MSARMFSRRNVVAALLAGAVAACEARKNDSGTVVVGSSATGVPFSFIDPWSNELTGSMVDTARAVARKADVPIELRVTPFSALIPSLLARKIDIIAAAMLRTREREKVVAFSEPVFAYSGGLVVPKSDSHEYPDLESLRRLRVGAQVGTRFIEQVNAAGVERVLTYDNLSDMLRDLGHGRIDAAYGDEPILAYQLKMGARPKLRLVRGFTAPAREELCFVFRQGDALIPRFNQAIEALSPSAIPAIVHHWGLV